VFDPFRLVEIGSRRRTPRRRACSRTISGNRSMAFVAHAVQLGTDGGSVAARRTNTVRGAAQATTDHDEIREWAERRGAHPAVVKGTGIIRLDFPGFSGEGSLEPISWEEFFEKFEESELTLLHQDKTGTGRDSNFNKLVRRSTLDEKAGGRGRSGAGARSSSSGARASGRRAKTNGASARSRANGDGRSSGASKRSEKREHGRRRRTNADSTQAENAPSSKSTKRHTGRAATRSRDRSASTRIPKQVSGKSTSKARGQRVTKSRNR
jgi:hypothetical protein